jgi:hypothetical protein
MWAPDENEMKNKCEEQPTKIHGHYRFAGNVLRQEHWNCDTADQESDDHDIGFCLDSHGERAPILT